MIKDLIRILSHVSRRHDEVKELRIVLKEINRDIPFEKNSHLLPLVSEARRERIFRLKNDHMKNVSLFAEITMIEEAAKDLSVSKENVRIEKTDLGKPYVSGFENYHISLSHCDGMILFASDSSPVGVDIEKPKTNFERIAKRFFTEDEYHRIKNAPSPADEFLLVWTRKEAFVKLSGEGLKRALDSFNVYDEEICSYQTKTTMSKISGKKYHYSICYNKK